jgi:hypothetical protein
MSSIYTNGSSNGNGGGKGNGHSPLLITGREIAALTNDDTGKLAGIAAQLVRGEAQLIKPTVSQAAAIRLSTIYRTDETLHQAPKTRLAAAVQGGFVAAKTNGNGMSPDELDAFCPHCGLGFDQARNCLAPEHSAGRAMASANFKQPEHGSEVVNGQKHRRRWKDWPSTTIADAFQIAQGKWVSLHHEDGTSGCRASNRLCHRCRISPSFTRVRKSAASNFTPPNN